MKSLSATLRCLARSRIAVLAVIVHLVLAVYALAKKPALTPDLWQHASAHSIPIAGRAVRIPDEELLLKTICWLDLPSLHILYVASFLAYFLPEISIQKMSWVAAAFLFVVTFVQWWLIGFFLERGLSSMRKNRADTVTTKQVVGTQRG